MHPGEDRDEDLMSRVADGQPALLEPLLRRHAGPLLTFIRRMVGDAHHSEELFQEVFLAVWTRRRQYTYPRPFKPWLYAIALNKCRASFRGRPGPVHLAEEGLPDPPAPGPPPPEKAIADETAALVDAAVTRLPPQQRAVVVLRIWEGLPYARIARLVGCSEITVRSHMHHGLKALRTYLEPHLGVTR